MQRGMSEAALPSERSMQASEGDGHTATLRAVELSKSFGATRALDACSVEIRTGEVHAILGENGSGKSTLVKLLAGVHRPDGGEIHLFGSPSRGFGSPRAAVEAGVVAVFQEVLMVGARSVLQNVWLGSDGRFRRRPSSQEKRRGAREALELLLERVPDLETPMEDFPLSVRQACGIARALVRQPRVLILDEATSALDVATRSRAFDAVRDLSGQGVSVVFISHRMDEIEEFGDRITVLRSGRTVATVERGTCSQDELLHMMTGAALARERRHQKRADRASGGQAVLRASRLRLRRGADPVDLEIRSGELVGVAGLEGQGQDVLLRTLWNGTRTGTVVIETAAGPRAIRSSRDASGLGIAYVPRDRGLEGTFQSLSIQENFAITSLARDSTAGFTRPKRTASRLVHYVDLLRIVLGDTGDRITTLSGGNQQKVILARWLATEPRILLLNDPTRGVDIGAKRDLYELLTQLTEDGMAVVMLSTEVDEHVELMDRVLVFRDYSLFAELPRASLSRDVLVGALFGAIAEDLRQ
jgi:ABC-type sugar transport system ATPase subunit